MTNPTSNYNFQMPTATDLVTDLPADFEVFGQAVDTRLKALQPGTTLGDLAYSSATANTNTRLGIGSAGQVLTVAAGVPSWATASAVSGPAFSAFRNTSNQTFSASTFTKVQFNGETFDTANNFDSTTNYRFTPTTAGYYQMSSNLTFDGTNSGSLKEIILYKNGSAYATFFSSAGSGTPGATACQGSSTLVYFNGSSDYAEVYIYDTDAVVCAVKFGSTKSYFTGVWIRS